MEWQALINIGGTTGLAIIGYLLRRAEMKRDSIDERLTNFRIEVAKDYITHNDLRKMEDALLRIEAKLDAKQDK